MGSGVLAVACRMDADTPAAHALYHLSYTPERFFKSVVIITDFRANCKG